MSEAFYTMKIEFDTEERARENLPKIKEFFNDLNKLYVDWQSCRWDSFKENPQKVLDKLIGKHDNLFTALRLPRYSLQGLNELSGRIAAGTEFTFKIESKTVIVKGEISHLSSWDRHCRAIAALYGALRVQWSKEY